MDEPTASAPTINCKSEFKIHNISIRNAPFLKDYYWNSMAITKFNKMLETANNYCCFRMTFPKVVRDYEPMTIVWHVKTVEEDSLPVEYSLKREKICECPMVPMQVGLNIFKKVYDCPHRKLIEMKPTAGVITGTGTDTIELNFQYNIEGSHCVVYLLTLPNVTIRLVFDITVPLCDPMKTIITTDLFPVAIEEHYALTQAIWIYNLYQNEIHYRFSSGSPELQIMNTEVRLTEEDALVPLFMKFLPVEIKDYMLPIDAKLHCAREALHIHTQCVKDLHISAFDNAVPKHDSYSIHAPILFKKNTLSVTIKQNYCISKLITIQNLANCCIKYDFIDLNIPEFISINVTPPNQVIRPNRTQILRVTIKSHGEACLFRLIPLKCNIYKINMKPPRPPKYPEGYFEITEKGYFEPPPPSPPPPKEQLYYTTYLNINVKVVQLMSLEFLPKIDHQGIYFKDMPLLFEGTQSTEVGAGDGNTDVDTNVLDKMLWNFLFCEDFKKNIVENSRKTHDPNEYLKFMEENFDDLLLDCLLEIAKHHKFIAKSIF